MRLLAIALLLAGSVFAADVDGKWSGTMSTPNGDVPVAFTFKADGATLNGTTAGPDGAEVRLPTARWMATILLSPSALISAECP